MKISAILIASAVAERKVPPRHPLQRLKRLTEFSHELLDTWYQGKPERLDAWKNKFTNNAERMKKSFKRASKSGNQRCGYYDENQLPHGGPDGPLDGDRKKRSDDDMDRYNREDPIEGTKQITTGFSKWAQRYISQCSRQKYSKLQEKRMVRWNHKLQAHMNPPGLCDNDDTCYEFRVGGKRYKVANYCSPYFRDIDGDDCNDNAYFWGPHLNELSSDWIDTFMRYAKLNKYGHLETYLNCPWTDGIFTDNNNNTLYTGEYTNPYDDYGYDYTIPVPENPWGCRDGTPQNLNDIRNIESDRTVGSSDVPSEKPTKDENEDQNKNKKQKKNKNKKKNKN